jgi:hypothetical protein
MPTTKTGPLPIITAAIIPMKVVRTFPTNIKSAPRTKLNRFCKIEKTIDLITTATRRITQEFVSATGPPTTLTNGRIGSHAWTVALNAKNAAKHAMIFRQFILLFLF